jgi:hypothetical protein
MLFAATTTSDLLASVGAVSTDVFNAATPYLLVAAGIPLAFYLIKKLISLIPKGR